MNRPSTKQGSSLKRKRKAPLKGQAEFWRAVTEDGTVDCYLDTWPGSSSSICYRDRDAHHLIPKQRIKREFAHGAWASADGTKWQAAFPLEAQGWDEEIDWPFRSLQNILADPRNGIPVCRSHHSQLENARIHLTRDDLPESVFAFAEDYGLEHLLDRAYPRSKAA